MCKKLMIVLAAVFISLQTVSAQSPPNCTGPGVQLKLDVFYADGITPATGDTLSLCETIIYRTGLCTAGGTSCDLQGGDLTLTLPDGTTVNVNPSGGIGTLNAAHPCTTPSVSTTYKVNILPGVQARATLTYHGVALTGGPAGTVVDVQIAVNNFIQSCDDQNACTVDTCDPLLRGPAPGNLPNSFRQGICVHTAIVCNDDNVCTIDRCDPVVGCIYTPNACDDGNPCTVDSCDRTAPVGTDPCRHTPKVCVSTDPCFTAQCNPTTGGCDQIPSTTHYIFQCPPDIQLPCGAPTDPSNTGGTCQVIGPLDANGNLPVVTITWEDHATPYANLPPATACTHKDGIIRIFFATDTCGRKQQCNFGQLITFTDITPPQVICPADKVLACGDSTDPSNTGSATATDDCGGTPAITHTDAATPANGTCVAGIDRTWTATDACGNSANCVQHITFGDTTPPVIACPQSPPVANATSPAGAAVIYPAPAVKDQCDPNPKVVCDPPSGSTFRPGDTTVTCRATDQCGNGKSCMLLQLVQERLSRSCARKVRQPVGKWPRLLATESWEGPLSFSILRNQS